MYPRGFVCQTPRCPLRLCWWRSWLLLCACLLLRASFPSNANADLWEGFESAETAWQLAEADCAVKTLKHERNWKEAHGGNASEYLHLALGTGNKAYLSYDIEPARVIAELQPSVWLKADRVGVQMFVRVVLPRAREPRTGRPITALVPGPTYSKAGVWQQLGITDMALQVERQVRVLRQQFGSELDPREAYIDKIVLNAYSEPGMVRLWIDDLEVLGHVAEVKRSAIVDSATRPAAFEDANLPGAPVTDWSVQLDGSLLLAGGRPLAVRAIEHNGESLAWLQAAGFNTVVMREPATLEHLRHAQKLGLWLIAPPQRAADGAWTITPEQAPILAWSLGNKLGPAELEATRQIARDLRAADNIAARPLLANAIAPLSAYSRAASILLLEPPPLGSSFELADGSQWLSERPRLARPGTPYWALLNSEPAAAVVAQLAAVQPRAAIAAELDYQQVRLQALSAVAAGARGLIFQSRTRLDSQDRVALQRADMLRLVNAELRLVEPWMSAGNPSGEVQHDDPQVRVSALQTERARLLVIRRHALGQQFVVGPPEKDRLTLVIPGTPSSSHVYRLSTLGMEPLPHKRVTGGMHITLEAAGNAALVVITQDPLVLGRVAKDLATLESQHARLHYDLVSRKLETTGMAARRLPLNAFANTARALDQATANLQQALRLLSANDRRGAEKAILQAERHVAEVQHGHFVAASKAFPSPVASALLTEFNLLPAHYQLAEQLRTVSFGPNVLAGGEMEDLQTLIQAGWRHQRDPSIPVETAVELAPAPHSGQSSLHLRVFANTPETTPGLVETPPVWVMSPTINVTAGNFVRIRGQVRTSKEIAGSREGVLVFDSIGGRALAQRLPANENWQPFTLFRAVPEDTTLNLTFALTGLGEVWIDDVEMQILDLPRSEPAADTNAPEELLPPGTNSEELPAPANSARGWWPRLR